MASPSARLIPSGPGSAVVDLALTDDADGLQAALAALAEDAFATGVVRLEAAAPTADRIARRALLRAGFRHEGVRRAVLEAPDGMRRDETVYARLASDSYGGPDGFSSVMNTALPRKRVIAHVLIREAVREDGEPRFVLCETRFKVDWELPGGVVEAGEPPGLGAVREVAEELGVDRPVGRLLVADWMPPYLGWEDALELIFDGGEVSAAEVAAFVLQPSEIVRAELVTLAQAEPLLTPLAHRRLGVALGLGPGETAYLEDGRRP